MQDARSAADAIVRVHGLTKVYQHPWTMKVTPGLLDASFDVRAGEIFGYLGPNGAGKTTTIKLLTGLLKPTSGNAWLMGRSIDSVASRAGLGFLPEQPYFYDSLTAVEYLELVAQLSGLSAREATTATRHWLGRVGLAGREKLVLRKYSKGMLQRLGLAAAMVHSPRLLILDEPMSGLDPFGRRDVRDLILEQKERGTTVMLSSHILPDVEALCDRVAIVLGGRIERIASVGELVRGGTAKVEVRISGAPLLEIPPAFAHAIARRSSGADTVFALSDVSLQQALLAWLVGANAQVQSVTPMRANLEDIFMAAAEQAKMNTGGPGGDGRERRRSA